MSHAASRLLTPLLLAAIFVGACLFADAHRAVAPAAVAPPDVASAVARVR